MPDIGGGGGRAPRLNTNNRYNLSKPYELEGDMTPEKMSYLNEMLQELYNAQLLSLNTLLDSDGDAVASGAGAGDVVGPASAVDGDIALFDGVTGKLIRDGNKLGADLVVGPASAVDARIALFDGTTGKLIKDSGTSLASLLSTATLNVATVDINEATLEAFTSASANDVVVVPAPGAGKIALHIRGWAQLNLATVYSNNPNWEFHYAGSGVLLQGAVAGVFSSATGKKFASGVDASQPITPSFDPANKAITVNLSAQLTGSGSATAKVSIVYIIVDQIS